MRHALAVPRAGRWTDLTTDGDNEFNADSIDVVSSHHVSDAVVGGGDGGEGGGGH